jgi:hypothetical protein
MQMRSSTSSTDPLTSGAEEEDISITIEPPSQQEDPSDSKTAPVPPPTSGSKHSPTSTWKKASEETVKMISKRLLFRNHQKIKVDTVNLSSSFGGSSAPPQAPLTSPLIASKSFTSLFTSNSGDASLPPAPALSKKQSRSKSVNNKLERNRPNKGQEDEVLSGEEILTATPTTASSSGGSTVSNCSNASPNHGGVRISLPSTPRSVRALQSATNGLNAVRSASPSPACERKFVSKSLNARMIITNPDIAPPKKVMHRKQSRSMDSGTKKDMWAKNPDPYKPSTPPPPQTSSETSATPNSGEHLPNKRTIYISTPHYSDEDDDPHLQMDPEALWNLVEQKIGKETMMDSNVSDLMEIAKFEAERRR